MANGIFKLRDQLYGVVQKAWTGSQKPPAVEYLVVAGGGGAGTYNGGGGAGGLLTGRVPVTAGTSYTVTVGTGGAGNATSQGVQGGSSVFGNISATGGGFGGYPAGNGGSGGGAGQAVGPTTPYLGGQNISGQGNVGGSYFYGGAGTANYVGGGGGGGAGTAGLDGSKLNGGNGGAGVTSAISGPITAYAGGGGGCGYAGGGPVVAGVGGVGGGGNGGADTATAGSANTGGGGGGGAPGASGAAGGSGIVILSYPDVYDAPASLAGTYTSSTTGSGSASFNGSAANINYAGSTSLSFGTGNLTVEFWAYKLADGGTSYDTVITALKGGGYSWLVELSTSRGFFFAADGIGSEAVAGVTINDGAWHHWAICRSGSTWYMFKDGVALTKTTDTVGAGNITATANVYIGSFSASFPFNGLLSNLRVLNGTALYTANFTPSTVPLTPIANTQLLMNTVSGAPLADSSVNGFVPSGTSSPTWSASSPFATGLGYKNRVYTWTGNGTVTF